MAKQAAVIFDMDGTLADCRHRLHFVEGPGEKNWDSFFKAGKDDRPNQQIVQLAWELSANNAIIIASGRPEKIRSQTENWLKKYKVPFAEIYLRGSNDRRPDGAVKSEMLASIEADGFAPWLVVDDRDMAVTAWRELGLCCLQCKPLY
jgi:phosphoglycolate phosphatase-like HAD superfamily hydrolase